LAGIYPAAVCPSLQALNVGYVLDFGDIDVGGNIQSFPGWANLATSPGFTLITQVGDAALYRIDACH
ncbi:MAG: hypothetical protein FWF28_06345, partial [Micrococcales bacterium]|nr:hypothetical protein [Micrococcales bacterium]